MATLLLPSSFLFFFFFFFFFLFSSLLLSFLIAAQDGGSPTLLANATIRHSTPLVGDDGTLYACFGKHLLAFRSNGTVAWTIPLGYFCRLDSPPVTDGGGKIYLIAEDRVLKVTPSNIPTSESSVEIFYGPNSDFGGTGEIVGICISIWSSCIFINVKKRGIFAFTLQGQLLWSAGPMLYRFGYLQGCRENVTDCYFSSPPVIDQCEGTIFIASSQGQVYSIYTRSPNFRWIKDFSTVDNSFLITPGNNGRLYVTFPRISSLMALDVSTGNVLWQNDIGPLNSEDFSPAIDSNGWVSIGSLDGHLYSFSPTGVPMKILKATAVDSIIQVGPVLDCSGFAVYVSQTRMQEKTSSIVDGFTYISAMKPIEVVLTMLVPATGAVYWTGKYPGEISNLLSKSDLRYFHPDEEILLAFLASSGINKFTPSYTTRQKLTWTCSLAKPKYATIYTSSGRKTLIFLLFQFVIIILLAMSIRFCCVFWQKNKLQELNLDKFLKKRRSLHIRRNACNRMISELKEKVHEEPQTSEVLEQLGDIVRTKESIERKLSTTYSLGRDTASTSNCKSILPLYEGNGRSYSFHCANKESVTIFNTFSGSSTSGEESECDDTINYCSSSSSSGSIIEEEHPCDFEDLSYERKGKAPLVEEPPSSCDATLNLSVNPLSSLSHFKRSTAEQLYGEDIVSRSMQEDASKRTMGLKRRRTLSSIN